eukprot:jgi/Botrbrau1/889/Bobra.0167s0012.1
MIICSGPGRPAMPGVLSVPRAPAGILVPARAKHSQWMKQRRCLLRSTSHLMKNFMVRAQLSTSTGSAPPAEKAAKLREPGPYLQMVLLAIFKRSGIPLSVKKDLLYLGRHFQIGPILENAGWEGEVEPAAQAEEDQMLLPTVSFRRLPPNAGLLEKLGLLGYEEAEVAQEKPKKKGFGAVAKAKRGGGGRGGRASFQTIREEVSLQLLAFCFGVTLGESLQFRDTSMITFALYTLLLSRNASMLPPGLGESREEAGARQAYKRRLECLIDVAMLSDDLLAPLLAEATNLDYDLGKLVRRSLAGELPKTLLEHVVVEMMEQEYDARGKPEYPDMEPFLQHLVRLAETGASIDAFHTATRALEADPNPPTQLNVLKDFFVKVIKEGLRHQKRQASELMRVRKTRKELYDIVAGMAGLLPPGLSLEAATDWRMEPMEKELFWGIGFLEEMQGVMEGLVAGRAELSLSTKEGVKPDQDEKQEAAGAPAPDKGAGKGPKSGAGEAARAAPSGPRDQTEPGEEFLGWVKNAIKSSLTLFGRSDSKPAAVGQKPREGEQAQQPDTARGTVPPDSERGSEEETPPAGAASGEVAPEDPAQPRPPADVVINVYAPIELTMEQATGIRSETVRVDELAGARKEGREPGDSPLGPVGDGALVSEEQQDGGLVIEEARGSSDGEGAVSQAEEDLREPGSPSGGPEPVGTVPSQDVGSGEMWAARPSERAQVFVFDADDPVPSGESAAQELPAPAEAEPDSPGSLGPGERLDPAEDEPASLGVLGTGELFGPAEGGAAPFGESGTGAPSELVNDEPASRGGPDSGGEPLVARVDEPASLGGPAANGSSSGPAAWSPRVRSGPGGRRSPSSGWWYTGPPQEGPGGPAGLEEDLERPVRPSRPQNGQRPRAEDPPALTRPARGAVPPEGNGKPADAARPASHGAAGGGDDRPANAMTLPPPTRKAPNPPHPAPRLELEVSYTRMPQTPDVTQVWWWQDKERAGEEEGAMQSWNMDPGYRAPVGPQGQGFEFDFVPKRGGMPSRRLVSLPVPMTLAECKLERDALVWQLGYLARELTPPSRRKYKAAGMLLYSLTPTGELVVLMGKSGKLYQLLGGKRKEKDRGPEGTALREMMEESQGLLSERDINEVLQPVLWFAPGLYIVFPQYLPFELYKDLPRRYAEIAYKENGSIEGGKTKPKELAWLPIHAICFNKRLAPLHGTYLLPNFLHHMLRRSVLVPWLVRRGSELAQAFGRSRKFVERNKWLGGPACWQPNAGPGPCETILEMQDTGLIQALSRKQSFQLLDNSRPPTLDENGDPGYPQRVPPPSVPSRSRRVPGGLSLAVLDAKASLKAAGVSGVRVQCREHPPPVDWEGAARQRALNSAAVLSQAMVLLGAASAGYMLDSNRRMQGQLQQGQAVLFPAYSGAFLPEAVREAPSGLPRDGNLDPADETVPGLEDQREDDSTGKPRRAAPAGRKRPDTVRVSRSRSTRAPTSKSRRGRG